MTEQEQIEADFGEWFSETGALSIQTIIAYGKPLDMTNVEILMRMSWEACAERKDAEIAAIKIENAKLMQRLKDGT